MLHIANQPHGGSSCLVTWHPADHAPAHITLLCGTEDTGALSMGFWSNDNGQGLIKLAGVVTGTNTCRLTQWLRNNFAVYAGAYLPSSIPGMPYLSATATCDQVAAFVNTVFNAASNNVPWTMLYAQFNAVCMDIYFSTTGLGWKDSNTQYGLKNVNLGGLGIGNLQTYTSNGVTASSVLGGTCLTAMQIVTKISNDPTLWVTATSAKDRQTAVKNVCDTGIIQKTAPIYVTCPP